MIDIKCGDCIEIMKQFKDNEFDLCLTDPPYNIGKDYGELVNDNKSYEEYKQFSIEWFTEARRVSKGLLFTPGHNNMKMWCHDIEYPKWIVIWYKSNKHNFAGTSIGGFTRYEPILAYDNVKLSIDHYNLPIKLTKYALHPTLKALELMKSLIKHSKDIKSVIDPFMGSGTTAAACMELGVDCVGIEINPTYVQEIKQRLDRTSPKTNVASWF